MLDFLRKPMFEYNLIDSFIIFGILILGTIIYYGIKLAIVIIQSRYKK